MNTNLPLYAVVSPVRNEEEFLPRTVESLRQQTHPPTWWVIVDDGSTDQTRKIAEQAAGRHPWIRLVNRPDRGFRQAGTGVVEAFYDGYALVAGREWEYLVKLDGDVTLPADYFEKCFARFSANQKLGIAGGTVCQRKHQGLEPESKVDPPFHVRGATKIYRRECWRQIGGLLRQPGWDTLDEVKANMLGWITATFPEIQLEHHRPAGGAYGTWNNWVKNGVANYIAGYHPLFMAVKCLKRSLHPPVMIGALGLGCGFLSGYLRGLGQVDDRDLIRYFRRQQLARLLGRPSLWDRKPALLPAEPAGAHRQATGQLASMAL
ncbi:MAG TPA: glycosyltransferase family A protein [Candidatus Acidoferrum sp.]|nr:glycosyltransferase family A protein [Candidatus Acidoferrum sp.]